MTQDQKTGRGGGPMDRLKAEARGLVGALGDRALASVQDKVEGAAGRLGEYVDNGAGPGLMAAVTGAKDLAEGKGPVRSALGAGVKGATEKVKGLFGGGGKGGGGKKLKVTTIVESIDVGVPAEVAYNQWTQFTDFPTFMKKVENVDQAEDGKLHWKAQVFWSHREWDADIVEQVPDERIIWRSTGAKGHVDGAVTFHEITPDLTRILVVLEYHPQGLFERTGNLWRAQGRRARLELKHFERHLMTSAILHPEEIEGWRGVIHDGEVVTGHESALAEEDRDGGGPGDRDPDDELDDEYAGGQDDLEDEDGQPGREDEYAQAGPEGEYEEGEERRPARGRPAARAGEGARAAGRARRPSGRPQRPGRSGRVEERPQRPVRRQATTRGGNSG